MSDILNRIREIAGEGTDVTTKYIEKNNGIKKFAIGIRRKSVEMLVYPDGFKNDEDIIKYVKAALNDNNDPINCEDCEERKYLMDKDYVLKHVYPVIVNMKRNKDNIESGRYLHKHFEHVDDIVIIYKIFIDDFEKGQLHTVTISKRYPDVLGLSFNDIDSAAFDNVKNNKNIRHEMKMFPLSQISNVWMTYGSGMILGIIDELPDGTVIIPSSVDDVIYVSACASELSELTDVEWLTEMINTVNKTLEDDEFLSDHPYVVEGGKLKEMR